jgi:AraC-like DNA-binding protein
MNFKRYFFFLSILSFIVLSSCRDNVKITHNELKIKDWQVCYSQDPDLNQVRANGLWNPIDPSILFPLPYQPVKGFQYVWLKSKVMVDAPEHYYGLSLGRIFFTDKVYVNGRLCGGHSSDEIQESHCPRNYELPQGTLMAGSNEIFVYLGIYGREYGGIDGEVKLLSKDRFLSTKIRDNLIFLQIPLGIMVFFFGMFIIVLIVYTPGERAYPTLIALGIIVICLIDLFFIFSPFQPFSIEVRTNGLWLCSFATSLLFLLFIEFYYRYFFKKITILFGAMELVFFATVVLSNDTTALFYPGRILGALNALITPLVIFYSLLRLKEIKPGQSIHLFWVFGMLPGMTISLDILNYLYGTHSPPCFHVYTIPVMAVLSILLHRQNVLFNQRKLKILTEKLKETSGDADGDGDGKKTVVSIQVESKLNELINFISENYTSSFTRELLAEKTGLSPDYLSRMFKIHTGKKINDYINDIRIDEACRLLKESDGKIIDIAFSVGFESLATFNRSFIKKIKVSPTEYRLNHTLD